MFRRIVLIIAGAGLWASVLCVAEGVRLRDGRHQWEMELVDSGGVLRAAAVPEPEWRLARLGNGRVTVLAGRRLILTLGENGNLERLAARHGLEVVRSLTRDSWLLQAPSVEKALSASAALGHEAGVVAAHPGYRRRNAMLAAWSVAPNDRYFDRQAYLDSPAPASGPAVVGSDLSIRSAWTQTRGDNVIVAICDDGMDGRHPDLIPNLATDLLKNFFTQAPSSAHSLARQYHGTAVAGLVAARDGNEIGIAGTAPRARVCGWVLFDRSDSLLEIEALAELFEYADERVAVQNHSWGNADFEPLLISDLEANALSNAATLGRQGRGVVHVRSAGNARVSDYLGRSGVGDANLDGFANAPWAITVGAVRNDGRVASYSTPGACVLVCAQGGERSNSTGLFSLDAIGNDGFNTVAGVGLELADYVQPGRGEVGTSFTSPQIAGLAALALSAYPTLSAPDVALALALSARPLAFDPVTQTNGAGLRTGDNVGFGVPHAGRMLELAGHLAVTPAAWSQIRLLRTQTVEIPNDGFRVQGVGSDGAVLLDVPASGSNGALLDTRHGRQVLGTGFPFTDVGPAEAPPTNDLRGQIAILERRPGTFEDKLNRAATAGAVAGIIVDDVLNANRTLMLRSEFARIPGAFVSKTDGDTLRAMSTHTPAARIRWVRNSARMDWVVTNSLSVHWVQVFTRISHPRQGDLRVNLVSPAGTVSLLQRPSTVEAGQLATWTYGSKQFLLEPSAGTWTLEVTDESPGKTGSISEAELILLGRPLNRDTDRDGLDDDWEERHFGGLVRNPVEDDDHDGLSLAAEQALRTRPGFTDDLPAELAMDRAGRLRLRWSVPAAGDFDLESSGQVDGPFEFLGTASGRPPEGAWFLPTGPAGQFYRVRPRSSLPTNRRQ